jgi:hypothetical protein
MLTGLGGSLLSHHFAERVLPDEFAGQLGESSAPAALSGFTRWWHEEASQLGPASSLRSIWDVAAARLIDQLGFEVEGSIRINDVQLGTITSGHARLTLAAGTWAASLDALWRDTVRRAVATDTPWVLCTNGRGIRLLDAKRTYSRAYLEFDLERTVEDLSTFGVFWGTLRAEAFLADGGDSLILRIIRSSARHGHSVNLSLRFGVVEAVQHLLDGLNKCGRHDLPRLFDESLTIVYRVLFLMFAESRSLVPNWHPVYRDSYTIESLRDRAERPGTVRGLWEALQAIARLAHKGCNTGTLNVPAFNGRLFSASRSPIAESCVIEDETARRALLALSTVRAPGHQAVRRDVGRSRRTRIDYRDLGVEQLGAVYESVLDFLPAYAGPARDRVVLQRGGDKRKSSGTFYTPQAITEYLVRRTLHPLVEHAGSIHILRLRVVDPAMGSGAFLVSACRYLARAYERALIHEGAVRENEVDEADRALFRRQIAQRCLFGVDLNPTAVQLARLSLWLATLAAGKPLTFLDHRLVCGDSLLGASVADLARQPPSAAARRAATPSMPLFGDDDLEPSLARTVGERSWMAETDDATAEVVREKERRLERLRDTKRWKSMADLWCACWMWPQDGSAPDARVFASLVDELARGQRSLPEKLSTQLLDRASEIARIRRFFHWTFEFPEVFFDAAGRPLSNGGFDAVLGNPPWDLLHAGCADKQFLRRSSIYRHQGAGHINRYQIFAERAVGLTRRGGRVGLVLPSGIATDHTAAPLRRHLLGRTSIDTLCGFDNRKAIFPIHRSVRFLTLTSTVGSATNRIACRFGIDDPSELETIPDAGDSLNRRSRPIILTPPFIASIDSDQLVIPELRTEADLRIVERIVRTVPRLDHSVGWNVRFGRELNATDDRWYFHQGRGGLPVLEGKHIEPFRAHIDRAAFRISRRTADRVLSPARTFLRQRLAYRDVASSSNRLTLIAAILPAGVVSTHSLFCLKTHLSGDNQAFLCAMLNSYVANYLIRQVMTTHLGSATVEALRVPKPRYDSREFEQIVDLARSLRMSRPARDHARLQALAARCYGLSVAEFEHVLGTFPLIEESERAQALTEFRLLCQAVL